jgi:hypothetical protein
VSLCAAFALASRTAVCEPTAMEKADARAWMAEGRTLRNQRNYEAALKSFKAADGIMHVPTTGFEVARTLEAMGRLVEARSTVRRVLSIQVSPTDPAPFQDAMAASSSLYVELEQRIPTVTFVLPAGTTQGTPTVWVDGQPVPASELTSPLRLDPGSHQIAAHIGQLDAVQTIELKERDRQPVVLKMPAGAAKENAVAGRAGVPWRTVAYVSFGTSAAGLVLGTVTGALALSTKQTAEAGCIEGRCPPSTWESIDRAHTYATISTVGFATFGAALGVGFASLALAPTRDSSSASSQVRPRVGLGYAGVEGTF